MEFSYSPIKIKVLKTLVPGNYSKQLPAVINKKGRFQEIGQDKEESKSKMLKKSLFARLGSLYFFVLSLITTGYSAELLHSF